MITPVDTFPDGSLTLKQPGLLRLAMEKLPPSAVVLLGFDHDEGGEKLAEEVKALAPTGREVRRGRPGVGSGKDWSEMLNFKLELGLT